MKEMSPMQIGLLAIGSTLMDRGKNQTTLPGLLQGILNREERQDERAKDDAYRKWQMGRTDSQDALNAELHAQKMRESQHKLTLLAADEARKNQKRSEIESLLPTLPEEERSFANLLGVDYFKEKAKQSLQKRYHTGSSPKVGMSPISAIGPDGKLAYFQPSNIPGTPPQMMQFPQGYQPTQKLSQTNLGDRVVFNNPLTGQPVITQNKAVPPEQTPQHKADVKAAEVGAVNTLKAQDELPQIMHASNAFIESIDGLLMHEGAPRIFGTLGSLPNAPGSAASDAQTRLNQIKGKVSLSAFESLKGAGTITDAELKPATEAKARLDQAQSWSAAQGALRELRREIIALQKLAQQRAGVTSSGGGSSGWNIKRVK